MRAKILLLTAFLCVCMPLSAGEKAASKSASAEDVLLDLVMLDTVDDTSSKSKETTGLLESDDLEMLFDDVDLLSEMDIALLNEL